MTIVCPYRVTGPAGIFSSLDEKQTIYASDSYNNITQLGFMGKMATRLFETHHKHISYLNTMFHFTLSYILRF